MKGHAQWDGPNHDTGTYYRGFTMVKDPQCALTDRVDSSGFNLSTSCTLQAIALQNSDGTPGAIQVVNALPGQRGNMKTPLETVGRWFLDANFGKTFQISESKTVQIRFDAVNVLNHPDLPDAELHSPNQNLNSAGLLFGRISAKSLFGTGSSPRTLSAQVRIGF
jgi:hypothetical protein